MQVRRRPLVGRSAAAIIALWFVVCGVLAMQHEASTAHIRNRAGGFVHAAQLTGHHQTGHESDVHGQRDPDADNGDCALLTAFHQAASAHTSAPALVAISATAATHDSPRRAAAARATAVYRLAPKTSPPAAV
jgi:hypothetical protein